MQFTKFTDVARKLPTPIYKFAAQRYIDYGFPRHIFIETTAQCNLTCSYCPREKRKEHMDYEMFKTIVDEVSLHGPRSFSLHLFGEPLLYPHIIEAIRYIKRKNSRHTVLLTTNGTLLNRYAEELDRSNVDRIIWSYRKNNFDSASTSLLRRKGLIRLLIEETPKEEFEKWSKFPRVEIKHLHNYGGNINLRPWGLDDIQDGRYPCYHLWLAPAVRWNGEITFCCNVPKAGEEVLGKYPETTLSQVWKGERLAQIRQEHMDKIYKGACTNCTSWKAYPSIW